MKNHFWSFGLTLGIISAFTITFIFTLWEWLENPSGIFHDQNGTNWNFVYDTAISWFIPTFVSVTVIGAVIHFVIKWFHNYRSQHNNENQKDKKNDRL